jgi:hypothetical protein
MKRSFRLQDAEVVLRTIGREDIEELRLWKNASRELFFHKQEITPLEQNAWFERYLALDQDYLFAVEIDGRRTGFMGYRMIGGEADIYAVIARPGPGGRTSLGRALRLLSSHLLSEKPARIVCKSLTGDPERAWFLEQGFRVASEKRDHAVLELDAACFKPLPYKIG